jgi:hypothetical protein
MCILTALFILLAVWREYGTRRDNGSRALLSTASSVTSAVPALSYLAGSKEPGHAAPFTAMMCYEKCRYHSTMCNPALDKWDSLHSELPAPVCVWMEHDVYNADNKALPFEVALEIKDGSLLETRMLALSGAEKVHKRLSSSGKGHGLCASTTSESHPMAWPDEFEVWALLWNCFSLSLHSSCAVFRRLLRKP